MEFTFPNIGDLLGSIAKLVTSTLDDQQYIDDDFIGLELEQPVKLGNVTLSLDLGATYNLLLINSLDDLKNRELSGIMAKTDRSALRAYEEGLFWLRHQFKTRIKGGAGFDNDTIDFDFSGEQALLLEAFRIHTDPKEKLVDAARKGFKPFLTALSFEDVTQMKEKEILGLQIQGRFKTGLDLNTGDFFSSSLSILASKIPGDPLALNMDSGLTVSFDVDIKDIFSLYISKENDQKYIVTFKKSGTDTFKGGVETGVEVKFKNRDELHRIVEQFFNYVTENISLAKLEELIFGEKFSGKNRDIILNVGRILGFGDELDTYQAKWIEWKATLEAELKEAIEQKIAISLNYEYQRINTEESLFTAYFEPDALKKYHKSLTRFQADELVDGFREGGLPGIKLKRFLYKKGLERTFSKGFSFNFFHWVAMAAKDKRTWEYTSREFNDKASNTIKKQIAFNGVRSVEDKLFFERNHTIDFRVESSSLPLYAEPAVSEMDFAFFLSADWQGKAKKRKIIGELDEIVDWAVVWEVITPDTSREVKKELLAKIKEDEDKEVQLSLELKFEKEVFHKMMREIYNQTNERLDTIFAQAMATALPYHDGFAIREDPNQRAFYYKDVCQGYLNNYQSFGMANHEGLVSSLASSLYLFLVQNQQEKLANYEMRKSRYLKRNQYSFAQVIKENFNTGFEYRAFVDGLKDIHEARLRNPSPYALQFFRKGDKFREMFQGWEKEKFYLIKSLGKFLLYFSGGSQNNQYIEKTLVLDYNEGGKRRKLGFGKG